jgi:ubiquinone/menaquinone biosynthesis C-methylase UbiE
MQTSSLIVCKQCSREFTISNNIISLLPKNQWVLPEASEALNHFMEVEGKFAQTINKPNSITQKIQSWGYQTIESFRKPRHQSTVLDLGCGTGFYLEYMNKSDKQVQICLDIDYNLLQYCKAANGNEKIDLLVHGDNYYLPFKNDILDQIISIYTLEHMHDLDRALSEVYRVMQRHGRFLVAIPSEGWLWRVGRIFTTARIAKKEFAINNYNEIIKLCHISNAKQIIKEIKRLFIIMRIKYYPFIIPSCDANLILCLECKKLQ